MKLKLNIKLKICGQNVNFLLELEAWIFILMSSKLTTTIFVFRRVSRMKVQYGSKRMTSIHLMNRIFPEVMFKKIGHFP